MDKQALFAAICELDGCGIVVTDTDLLAAELGIELEDDSE